MDRNERERERGDERGRMIQSELLAVEKSVTRKRVERGSWKSPILLSAITTLFLTTFSGVSSAAAFGGPRQWSASLPLSIHLSPVCRRCSTAVECRVSRRGYRAVWCCVVLCCVVLCCVVLCCVVCCVLCVVYCRLRVVSRVLCCAVPWLCCAALGCVMHCVMQCVLCICVFVCCALCVELCHAV
jgi:hypothetical protein